MTASERLPDRRVVVTALGVTQILAWGSTFYLLAVLAPYIARDTGWTYDRVVIGASVGLFVAGLVSPRVGRFISSHGGRPVLAIGALLLAAGLAALGAANSFPIYLAAWAVIGAGMGASLYDAAFSTLGNIYGNNARPSDYGGDAVRWFRQHRLLAAKRVPRGASGMARGVLRLCGNPDCDLAAASPARAAARTACRQWAERRGEALRALTARRAGHLRGARDRGDDRRGIPLDHRNTLVAAFAGARPRPWPSR